MPRFIGPGCMTKTSFLHRWKRSQVRPKKRVNSRTRRELAALDPLELHAEHVDHVDLADDRVEVVDDPRAELLERLAAAASAGRRGSPRRRASSGAHRFDRATRLLAMSPTIATFSPSTLPEPLADRVEVEQALRRVLVGAVAGVDDAALAPCATAARPRRRPGGG